MPKKKAKKAAKKPEKIAVIKAEPKKSGLPILQILGAIIVIGIIGGWLFLNSLDDSFEEVDFGVPDVGIDVLELPIMVDVGEQVTITWRVLGTDVDKSELVYSVLPKGEFGEDFDVSTLEVDGSGYERIVEGQAVESEFEGETFSATIDVEYTPVFMRIHAVSGPTNFWTDEFVLLGVEIIMFIPHQE